MRIILNFIFLFYLFVCSCDFFIASLTYRKDIIKFNKSLSFLLKINFHFEKVSCISSLILSFFEILFVLEI